MTEQNLKLFLKLRDIYRHICVFTIMSNISNGLGKSVQQKVVMGWNYSESHFNMFNRNVNTAKLSNIPKFRICQGL